MSGMKSDVLVIGGGTAACAAAEAVLQAGKKVTMVFPNGGSSEVSAGSVDILGVVPGEELRICEDYREGQMGDSVGNKLVLVFHLQRFPRDEIGCFVRVVPIAVGVFILLFFFG